MLAIFVTAGTSIVVTLIAGWFALKSSDAHGTVTDYILDQLRECEEERDGLRRVDSS